MDLIDVLIVEDDARIAQIHSQILRQTQHFNPVGIAETIQMARTMVKVYKPNLIILDNYLPDGTGIDLFREIIADKSAHKIEVVLITASDEIETVKTAMKLGCFDYLLKPVSYERLQETLNRYLALNNAMKAYENLEQRHIDELFNIQLRDKHQQLLPKGIESITLEKIKRVFSQNIGVKYTVDQISQEIGIGKTTARRYLEYCSANGLLTAENQYGKVGRPERVYVKLS
ncbi:MULTISPECIES: response regulator [Vibrio]|uniref:Transcriptional regulatory protein n=1 Tax=Vibrio casei TaxID=673372 RepID=A0A368LIJ3_9VIBR|nr:MULTISPECIES: response regulator [Vibrio]RCS70491.1 response regulator [Vibrio casei]SJN28047.1 Transcriptional regulatory protein CitB, DpiA [Vibrio casei]HBV77918.1 response regulator [Vibrio sp.]